MTSYIDSQVLTDLVRKYKVELLPNPMDRHMHWLRITEEYNKICGTSFSYQSLSKKLANMKQRDRQKVMAEKKRKSVISASPRKLRQEDKGKKDLSQAAGIKDKSVSGDEEMDEDGVGGDSGGGGAEDDDSVEAEEDISEGLVDEFGADVSLATEVEEHVSDSKDYIDSEDAQSDKEKQSNKALKIIRVVREKGSQPSAKLLSAKGVNLDPKSEEGQACTRQGYENLLRDLLTCLAKKYRIEEPCGSSQVKHEIWRQLTNEYLQLTGGLVNVTQKEVMRKWTNMKFTCKAKGIAHPLMRADQLDIKEVERKLKLCQRFVIGDELMQQVETKKRLEAIKEQVKVKSKEEQAERDCKPPLRRLERQILVETLRYEQEKLAFLRESARMEQQKLAKDVELASIEIEKAKLELDFLKRRHH